MTAASLGVFVGGRFIWAAHFFAQVRIVLTVPRVSPL